jgi:hypothetical protein
MDVPLAVVLLKSPNAPSNSTQKMIAFAATNSRVQKYWLKAPSFFGKTFIFCDP